MLKKVQNQTNDEATINQRVNGNQRKKKPTVTYVYLCKNKYAMQLLCKKHFMVGIWFFCQIIWIYMQ